MKENIASGKSLSRRQFGRWLVASGIGLTTGACAMVERAGQETAKQEVAAKARERWDLVLKGEVEKAYGYFTAASRTALSLDEFRKRSAHSHRFRGVTLGSVDCGADTCRVTITLTYDIKDIKGLTKSFDETWIREADTWWLVDAG